jgi:HAD superfamily hydrolase (TIGR01509 family)
MNAETWDADDIRAVVFDVGGVFFLPTPEPFRVAFAAAGVTASASDVDFHRAHYVATAAFDRAGGENGSADECWHAYLSTYAAVVAPDHDVRIDELAGDWPPDWGWPQADAVDALRRLVDADWPVAIVSNSDGTVEDRLRSAGVCQVGDGDGASVLHITDSHVVGAHKPDPAIFVDVLAVMAERGIAPSECLYVGDTRSADVLGATAAGMRVVHIDPYDLYVDHDHPRAASVVEVVDRLLDGR